MRRPPGEAGHLWGPRSRGIPPGDPWGPAAPPELTHLHGVQRQVAGNLELLPENLLPDVIDAHELGHPSRQDALAVRGVAQSGEGPGQRACRLSHYPEGKWPPPPPGLLPKPCGPITRLPVGSMTPGGGQGPQGCIRALPPEVSTETSQSAHHPHSNYAQDQSSGLRCPGWLPGLEIATWGLAKDSQI